MERTGNVPGGDGAAVGFREAMRRFDARCWRGTRIGIV